MNENKREDGQDKAAPETTPPSRTPVPVQAAIPRTRRGQSYRGVAKPRESTEQGQTRDKFPPQEQQRPLAPAPSVARNDWPEAMPLLLGLQQELKAIRIALGGLNGTLERLASEREQRHNEKRKRTLRSAMFVDFDNIFIAFNDIAPQLGDYFVNQITSWVDWFESGKTNQSENQDEPMETRDLHIRKCYLNPRSFHKYRDQFVRSGFQIVDCPPISSRGKTSTDMRMVIDIMNSMQSAKGIDEYIIMSSDADFMPILLSLREAGHLTTVVAIGPTSEHYRSACDRIIDYEDFREHALGMSEEKVEEHRVEPELEEPVEKKEDIFSTDDLGPRDLHNFLRELKGHLRLLPRGSSNVELLTKEEFRVLFAALAWTIRQHGNIGLLRTSARVSDLCSHNGWDIYRNKVQAILQEFRLGPELLRDPKTLSTSTIAKMFLLRLRSMRKQQQTSTPPPVVPQPPQV
ncbi:MAG: hypothetical protein A2284_17845 [Deltaproteobacteria bacterium RIFOXYA12_FULL_61_11]|nr:MAG: hypothetical protein A2284_17845 [Deltaproteobacteria bacterium RIFOXYA12_FULL_61_11]